MQDSVGMPIGVQVAAPKWKDEQCLAIMKILEDSVKFLKRPNTDTINPYSPKASFNFIKYFMLVLMAALYIYAGYMHFARPEWFLVMMPTWMPYPLELVYLSGIAEIAGGVGVLIPQTRKLAAWGIIALLFAVLPANFHIAIYNVPLMGSTEGPGIFGWIRIPLQILLIMWARWYTE